MKVITYTPHGALPDTRGFAPAIVAHEIASRFSGIAHTHVSAREDYASAHTIDPSHGEIWRIAESAAYRLLFRKLSRLDPYPLHARLARICAEWQPDLLHSHQLEFPISDFRRRAKRDLPVVVHAHAVRSFDSARGTAERYIAVANFTRDALVARGFPADKINVIPNGANTDLFAPADAARQASLRAAHGIATDEFVVAYAGRKQASKGFVTFLQALQTLAATGLKVRGIAAGPTPPDTVREEGFAEREVLRQQLIAQNLLIDLPPLPHSGLAALYPCADVLLFATRFKGEQHPLVLIEALASGCVVVTSGIAGILETVTAGKHAIIMDDASDANEAAQRILHIAQHPQDYLSMRQAGRQRAQEHYDWRAIAARVQSLYSEVLTGKS